MRLIDELMSRMSGGISLEDIQKNIPTDTDPLILLRGLHEQLGDLIEKIENERNNRSNPCPRRQQRDKK
jgi:hypothetical protein